MKFRIDVGETRDGQPCAFLWDEGQDKMIAKLYPSKDGRKIRVVLGEGTSNIQFKIDQHTFQLLDFTRSEAQARAEVAAATRGRGGRRES